MFKGCARGAWTLAWLTACALSCVHAAELRIEPSSVPSGKETRININAPGPGEVMLVPGGPYVKATMALPANHILGLDVSQHLAYSAQGGTLKILSLTDFRDVLSRYEANNTIAAVSVQGDHVHLSLDNCRIVTLDVHDPRNPHVRRELTLPHTGYGITMVGQYALQATGRYELLIWDIADPTQPRLASRYITTGATYDVTVSEGRAYVAQHTAGLLILDVQDPTHPRWLGSTGRLGTAIKVVVQGDSAWIGTIDNGVSRIDVFNAAQPSLISKMPLDAPGVQALAAQGDDAFVATAEGITHIAFDAEPPQNTNADLDVGRGVNFGGQRRADVVGDLIYVADWFSGMHIYDVSKPEQPRLLSSLHTPGSSKGIVVRDNYAFVADDDHGLQVVDVRDVRVPRIVANLGTPGLAYTPKLAGNLLYLASHRGGFQIIDVTKPTEPKIIADVPTPGMAWSLAVAADKVYVADDAAGLLIYDVRDPAQPQLIGTYDSGGRLEDVLVQGDVAYLAYFDQGIKIVDVRVSATPHVLAELDMPGNARGLDLQGHDLYVADWLAGVHVVDVTDPAHPNIARGYDTPGAAWGVRVHGDRAYVLDWWGGFGVLRLPTTDTPTLARYAERGRAIQVAAQGDYLYVAQGEGGLQIFDIKNPLNPTWITGVELAATAIAVTVTVEANIAYVGLAGGGIAVVDITSPYEARLVMRLDTAREVNMLRIAGKRLFARAGSEAYIFDLTKPLQPSLAATPAGNSGDLWVEGEQLYVGYGIQVWRSAGVAAIEPPRAASLLRGQHDLIAAVDRVHGDVLTIYKTADNGLEELTTMTLSAPIRDMAWGEGMLYVGTNTGIVTLDMSTPRTPKIITIQRGPWSEQGMTLHRGVLYMGLTALRPLSELTAEADAQGTAQLMLPASLPIGGYDLLYAPAQNAMQVQHNALKIQMPRFGKPKFSMEDLKKSMEAIKREQQIQP